MCSPIINAYLATLILLATTSIDVLSNDINARVFQCGPYGFICEGNHRLRLCEDTTYRGPAFICPPNTVCNEDSNDVCDNTYNYIPNTITRNLNCRRNERIADPSVPGCKGYILCVTNKNRIQGIKFKCSGSTIFNGYTRTCSSPEKYKCPIVNVTETISDSKYFEGEIRRISHGAAAHHHNYYSGPVTQKNRTIDCKDYKLRVTEDSSPVRATYFCPSNSPNGGPVKCTIFSNQYCLTLERAEEDQFLIQAGLAYRKPRTAY